MFFFYFNSTVCQPIHQRFVIDGSKYFWFQLNTSMSIIAFDRAKLFVKAGDKFTHVYVLDGTATVLDNKSKKKKVLKAGDYLVITPQATLSPRESAVTSIGNSFSVKEVEDVERDAHTAEIKTLQSKLDNVLFVNYGTNIFGVKLHP